MLEDVYKRRKEEERKGRKERKKEGSISSISFKMTQINTETTKELTQIQSLPKKVLRDVIVPWQDYIVLSY